MWWQLEAEQDTLIFPKPGLSIWSFEDILLWCQSSTEEKNTSQLDEVSDLETPSNDQDRGQPCIDTSWDKFEKKNKKPVIFGQNFTINPKPISSTSQIWQFLNFKFYKTPNIYPSP